MAQDHFLAQTYLKHFGDPALDGMLHAYRKSNGAAIKCWPQDVCREWDGDLNKAIADRPELLGDYRKIFEPGWNPAIQNILAGAISPTDKFVVSAYMANMMVCTPAWRRVGEKMYSQQATGHLMFEQEMKEKHGTADEELDKAVESLKRGDIALSTNPDYIKAIITRHLLVYACLTYNLDWLIMENDTDQPYLTSDNPVAMAFSGRHGDPVTRILPVTPKLCLSVTYDSREANQFDLRDVPRILKTPPRGAITRAKAKPVALREVNRLIVQCAEDFVFSSREDDGARKLTEKYAKFRIDPEFVEFPGAHADEKYQGTIIRVREVGSVELRKS